MQDVAVEGIRSGELALDRDELLRVALEGDEEETSVDLS